MPTPAAVYRRRLSLKFATFFSLFLLHPLLFQLIEEDSTMTNDQKAEKGACLNGVAMAPQSVFKYSNYSICHTFLFLPSLLERKNPLTSKMRENKIFPSEGKGWNTDSV